jgi:putative ATP-binding cassette transporter
MMFISPKHYIPPGTLRGALAYPSQPSQFTSEDYISALERTELARLAPGLDRVASWERELTSEEIPKFALARLLLHKPRWIVLDEAIDHIDDDTRGLVLDVFGHEAAIINIGHADTRGGFFTRVLHLIEDPQGQRLAPCPAPAAKQKAPAI